jgi:hypothetical protein
MDDDVEEPPEAAELSEAAIEVVVEAVADVAAGVSGGAVVVDPDDAEVCANRLLKLCDSSKQIFFHR